MSLKFKILVVDDESSVTRVLGASLSAHGFKVKVANDGRSALRVVKDWSPHLIVADLCMPKMTGIELCERIREYSQSPIIVLTVRGDNRKKIEALNKGADDYIAKPFSIDELILRIVANLWRIEPGVKPLLSEPIEAGDFRIDPEARLVWVRGREVHLTPKEFDLLVYMVRNAGKVLAHRTLLNAVWCGRSAQSPEDLRVYVNTLRKKIEPAANIPCYILTEPWTGYRFQPLPKSRAAPLAALEKD